MRPINNDSIKYYNSIIVAKLIQWLDKNSLSAMSVDIGDLESISNNILTELISLGENINSLVETASKITVVSSGNTAVGNKSVTFITDDNFIGTILGDTAKSNSVYTFTASMGNTLNTIPYTITSGSLEILTVI